MAKKVNLNILKKIIREVNPRIRDREFHSKMDLFEEGILDSFSVIQMVNVFEERFGIVFDYGDLKANYFRNLDSLQSILVKKYGLVVGSNAKARGQENIKRAGAKKNKA